jgi:hypothetical protein
VRRDAARPEEEPEQARANLVVFQRGSGTRFPAQRTALKI